MAVQGGTAGSVVVGTVVVGRVKEWSMDVSRDAVEITGMGMGWREFIPGVAGATGSFSLVGDWSDVGQAAMKSAALGAGTVGLKLGGGTALWTIGTAIISGPKDSIAYDGASAASYDFTASGVVS